MSLLSIQKELNAEIKEKTIDLESLKKDNDQLLERKKADDDEPQFGLQPQNTYMSMMDLKMPNEYAPEDIISFYQI